MAKAPTFRTYFFNMPRRKYEDLEGGQKFRCCFGYLHISTVTITVCILMLIYCAYFTTNSIAEDGFDSFALFTILYFLTTAGGPLIGIKMKQFRYFVIYYIGPMIRIPIYSILIIAFFFIDSEELEENIDEIIFIHDSPKFEGLFRLFSKFVIPFLISLLSVVIFLELWISYVIYKCYKYVTETSLINVYKKPAATGKRKGCNPKTSKDIKQSISSTKFERIKECFDFVKSILLRVYKKFNPSEAVKDSETTNGKILKEATLPIKSEEPEITEATQKIIADKNITEKSKPMECHLNVAFTNLVFQQESANAIRTIPVAAAVQLKTKTSKQDTAIPKPNDTSLQEFNPIKIGAKKSRPEECDLIIGFRNDMVESESAKFTVKLKSFESLTAKIKLPSSHENITMDSESHFEVENRIEESKTENLNTNFKTSDSSKSEAELLQHENEDSSPISTDSESYFNETHISPPKKKHLVSIEVQTDETSFVQSLTKTNPCQNHGYDSDEHSFISPKAFSPSSTKNELITDQKSINASSSGFVSVSDADFSPFQTSSPTSESATIVTFLFKNDETCAVEVCQNGVKQKLRNVFDNEWTPLYFSMARPTFEIGETAQIHLQYFREFVLYDIFKVIGKSMHEIEIDPEWKFKVVEQDGIQYFQIKTQNGLRLFPENSIVAAFLKSLKLQAQTYLNSEICEIRICTNFELTESQKNVFKNAALKLHLKILSFFVSHRI